MEVPTFINTSTKEVIKIIVLRNDKPLNINVKPKEIFDKDNLGNKSKKIIGIKISPLNEEFNRQRLGPAKAIYYASKETWFVTKTLWNLLY